MALVVLVALRVVAPWIVAAQIESRLSEALGAAVQVEDVALRLWAGELQARGLHVAPADPTSASALRVRTIRVGWRWRELIRRGGTPLDLQLDGVALTIDARAPWPGRPAARASAGLGPLRSLSLRDGRLDVVARPDAAPIPVLHGVRAVLDEGAWAARGAAMTTRLRAVAGTGEGGRLALTAAMSPAQPRETWTLQFALHRLDLRQLNPLLQDVLEMGVEAGTLSLTGDLTRSGGRLRGHLVPRFDDLTLLGVREPVRHPMAEALFSSMLATADLPIEIDRAAGRPGGLALTLDDTLGSDAMDLLRQVILNGFTRRLNTLDGHDATIGGLEVDFPRGVLAFTDVTLRKTGGAAELPFLHVARFEVIVEPSVVDPSTETFKSVILREPTLVYIVGRTEARSQRSIDPDWQAKVSALPYPTDRLEIVNGRIEYLDENTSPPSHFVLSGLDLTAENLARARRTPGTRGATLRARAQLTRDSPLVIEAAFAPGSEPLDGELRLSLAPVELTRLNGLLRSNFGVDVSTGTLGLAAELDARAGRLTGSLTPALSEVSVLGVDEEDITHPLRELLIELRLRRLDGVRLPIEIHARRDLLRKLPRALLAAIRDVPARPRRRWR